MSVLLLTSLLLWALYIPIYRLFFSPIAAIPGPKLAAITQWYEAYYNVYLGEKFTLHLEKLHAKYGPIVRINPWEVHINDPEFFETIYSMAAFDKVSQHVDWCNIPSSTIFTLPHDLHRLRRSALNPFFSKRQIYFYASEIQARATKFCNRINVEYKNKGNVLQLDEALACFTAANITINIINSFSLPLNHYFITPSIFKTLILSSGLCIRQRLRVS
jgi:hypothetical protein